jgi:hypothetical protein
MGLAVAKREAHGNAVFVVQGIAECCLLVRVLKQDDLPSRRRSAASVTAVLSLARWIARGPSTGPGIGYCFPSRPPGRGRADYPPPLLPDSRLDYCLA